VKFFSALLKRFVPILIIVVCLMGSYGIQKRMNAIRVEYDLTDTEIAENAPPIVAFTTVALGSFRGVVADMLWLYSGRMKDEGNYFEMYQLASWMVKLQPRFTGATAYLAWNMAYNISVTFPGFEERWRWVQRGIELIRDEALLYNPGDPELYKELGWIYQHKVGQEMDDANRFYKLKMAEEMTMILGGYPIDWDEFAVTPGSLEGLLAGTDGALDLTAVLKPLDYDLGRLEREFRSSGGTIPEVLVEPLAQTGYSPLVKRFLHLRWLKEDLKLDPVLISELASKYGDLDWRLPEAHAIYWATLGLNEDNDMVNVACERMISQSLANAFRGGRLAYVGSLGNLEVTPNIDVVDAVDQQYLDTIANHESNFSFQSGYRNWLIDTTVTLYLFGGEKKAAEYYEKLQGTSTDAKFRVPLARFVLRELAGDLDGSTFDQAHGIVQGLVYQGLRALAVGDAERAAAYDQLSGQVWEKYMAQIGTGRSQNRRKLPPLREMRTTMYDRRGEFFPPDICANLEAMAAVHRAENATDDGDTDPR